MAVVVETHGLAELAAMIGREAARSIGMGLVILCVSLSALTLAVLAFGSESPWPSVICIVSTAVTSGLLFPRWYRSRTRLEPPPATSRGAPRGSSGLRSGG